MGCNEYHLLLDVVYIFMLLRNTLKELSAERLFNKHEKEHDNTMLTFLLYANA